jgi:hypothetical protein
MSIINPLPNIYVTNDENINIQNILNNNNNISAIISVTESSSDKVYDVDKYNMSIYKFAMNNNKINFKKTNQIIYQFLKNNKNIIIYEKNLSISFAIVAAFYFSNVNFQFFQFIYVLSKKMNMKIDNIDNLYLEQIFDFYNKHNNKAIL